MSHILLGLLGFIENLFLCGVFRYCVCFLIGGMVMSQCPIQRKFWDNVFSWSLVYFPQYQLNFNDLYCFSHFQRLLFICTRCSLTSQNGSLFTWEIYQTTNCFFYSFLGTCFLGTHVWTLPFSVWIQSCVLLVCYIFLVVEDNGLFVWPLFLNK